MFIITTVRDSLVISYSINTHTKIEGREKNVKRNVELSSHTYKFKYYFVIVRILDLLFGG